MKKDKDNQALKIWEKVLEMDSTNSDAGITLANQYIKDKKFEKAYQLFQNLYEFHLKYYESRQKNRVFA